MKELKLNVSELCMLKDMLEAREDSTEKEIDDLRDYEEHESDVESLEEYLSEVKGLLKKVNKALEGVLD